MGVRKNFWSQLQSMIYWLSHTSMCENQENHDSGLFYYEWAFSIVNDRRSPSIFWCFPRDSKGTKMTRSWISLTISCGCYHSKYEVWHKCDQKKGRFGATCGHVTYKNLKYEGCMLGAWSQGMSKTSWYHHQNDWSEETMLLQLPNRVFQRGCFKG